MSSLHVVVIDGSDLTRALLKYVFNASSAVQIIGEAADYKSAVAILGGVIPDAVIIGDDLSLEDKAALLQAMQLDYPGIRVIQLSALENAFLRRARFGVLDNSEESMVDDIISASSGPSIH